MGARLAPVAGNPCGLAQGGEAGVFRAMSRAP